MTNQIISTCIFIIIGFISLYILKKEINTRIQQGTIDSVVEAKELQVPYTMCYYVTAFLSAWVIYKLISLYI